MDLSVKIGRIKMPTPVMVASGTFGYGEEFKDITDFRDIAAIVTKSVTLKPKQGNPPPRLWETTAGMLNSIGLQNEGVDDFIKNKLPFLKELNIPVIVSIAGDSVQEYGELARRLSITGVDALEINISCPNIKRRQPGKRGKTGLFAQDKKDAASAVSEVRKNTKKTIITKLSPEVSDIGEIAESVQNAGSDAICVTNTITAMSVDIETQKPRLGNITGGLSGPAIKPIALRLVWEANQAVKIPVIGAGGIMNAKDAIEFMLCGASCVQIGTANFINPKTVSITVKGIAEYLKKKGLSSPKDITGKIKI